MLLAHLRGDGEAQDHPFGQLRGILLSIPYKKNWFPKDEGTWLGPIDEALVKQCEKFADLDARAIFLRMIQGGFGYVYTAVENKLIDEIRRRDTWSQEVSRPFDRPPKATVDPEHALQARDFQRLLVRSRKNAKPFFAGVLEAVENLFKRREDLQE
jgi:hypothetical protein